ncbi:MAG: helix-turn-helix domain-containing protein [Proteobacteria bacterium]|nr:helix-turn-helix domain-containing protein [Pseudomonadota bacterium]
MKQIRRKLGKYLKKIREERSMTLLQVAAYLEIYKIECSYVSLSRIESGKQALRADVLAGLSLIYEIRADEILFRGHS